MILVITLAVSSTATVEFKENGDEPNVYIRQYCGSGKRAKAWFCKEKSYPVLRKMI